MPHTHYELLQVGADADPETIRESYHRLIRRFHPDVNDDPNAEMMARQLNAAYAVLSDPDLRAQYDRHLMMTRRDWDGASSEPAAEWQGVVISPADARRAHRRTVWAMRLRRARWPLALLGFGLVAVLWTHVVRPAVIAEMDPPFRLGAVTPDRLMAFDRLSPALSTLRRHNASYGPRIARYMHVVSEMRSQDSLAASMKVMRNEERLLRETLTAAMTLRDDCSLLELETEADVLQAKRWQTLAAYFSRMADRVRNSLAMAALAEAPISEIELRRRARTLIDRDLEYGREMQTLLALSP